MVTILLLLFGVGIDLHEHATMPYRAAMQYIRRIPMWDFNETTINGNRILFSGDRARFSDGEIRAWNTAIMFTVEDGFPPAFITPPKFLQENKPHLFRFNERRTIDQAYALAIH